MNNLNKSEMIALIQEMSRKHDITAYEFNKETSVSIFAAQKILNGETKNPNQRTLDELLNYIDEKITGSKINDAPDTINAVSEPAETYTSEMSNILSTLRQIQKTIRTDHDAIADALRLTYLNTEEIKENGSAVNNSINTLITTINSRGNS